VDASEAKVYHVEVSAAGAMSDSPRESELIIVHSPDRMKPDDQFSSRRIQAETSYRQVTTFVLEFTSTAVRPRSYKLVKECSVISGTGEFGRSM
jgi:hypothetical protein